MPLFVYCKTRPTGKKLDDNGRPIAFGVGDLAYNIYTFKNNANTSGDATSYQYFCHPLYNTGSAGGGNQTIDITSTTESNRQATVFNNITTSYQHQITKSNATLTFTKETNVQVSGSPDTNVSFDPKAGSGSVTVLTKKLGTSGTNGHTVTYTTAQLSIAQENVVTTAGTKGSGNILSVQTGTDEAKFVTYIKPSSNKNGHEISYVIDTIKVSKETNVTVSGTAGTATTFDPKAGSGSVTVLTTSLVPSETNGHNIKYTTSVLNIAQETPVSTTGTAGAGGHLDPITGDGSATFVTKITPSTGKNGHAITYTTAKVTIGKESSITHGTDTTSTNSPGHGGTFTVIDGISFSDTNNHTYKVNVKTVTLPSETSISKGTNSTSTSAPGSGGTFTVIDNIGFSSTLNHTYNYNLKTVTMPTPNNGKFSVQINGTEYTNVTANQAGDSALNFTDGVLISPEYGNNKFKFNHKDAADFQKNWDLGFGEKNITGSGNKQNVITYISTDKCGHINSIQSASVYVPAPGNGTLTIQKDATDVGTFTANQSSNSTINITKTGHAFTTESDMTTHIPKVKVQLSNADTFKVCGGQNIVVRPGTKEITIAHADPTEENISKLTANGGTDTNITGTDSGVCNVVTAIKRDSQGHVTGIESKNLYSTNTHVANHTFNTTTNVANESVNVSLSGTNSSGGGSDTFIVGTTTTTAINITQSNKAVIIDHANRFSANGTAKGDDTKTLSFGGTFTIPTISYNAAGHITGWSTTTMTMPANPNTDTKVTSAGNHYAPSSGTKKSAIINAIDYDSKGHIYSCSTVTAGITNIVKCSQADYENSSKYNRGAGSYSSYLFLIV